jgi:hypothetical protein
MDWTESREDTEWRVVAPHKNIKFTDQLNVAEEDVLRW